MIPIQGIRVRFARDVPKRVHLEPCGRELKLRRDGEGWVVKVPPLEIHAMVVVALADRVYAAGSGQVEVSR
jgi:hypothetical protein